MSHKYEELERAAVLDDEEGEPQHAGSGRNRIRRLPHLPGPFIRIPIAWLDQRAHRTAPFTATQRLYLLLLYRSYWGQRGVKLTSAVAAEIGMSPRTKQWCVLRLEQEGWARVERDGRGAPVVWPIVLSG